MEEQEGKLLEKLTLYLGLHSMAACATVKARRTTKPLQDPLIGSDSAVKLTPIPNPVCLPTNACRDKILLSRRFM